MRVRFWGTRGSIAKAGPSTVHYGGNTSCVEVRAGDGTLVVLDCGTGAHGLGQALLEEPGPIDGTILIGHTHWDHIQGMPFFAPLFEQGNTWHIYAPRGLGEHLEDTLAGQMQYTYFPISLKELGASIQYHELVEETFMVGSIEVTAQYLNHPALTLGYRLKADGATLVYATDHEPFSRKLAVPEVASPEAMSPDDRRHCEFLTRADLVIHDAQYLASEYPSKIGWGHSTVEYVVTMASEAKARRLALFHHDPLRHDQAVDHVVEVARERARALGSPIKILAASEGLELDLAGRSAPTSMLTAHLPDTARHSPVRGTVVLAIWDPERAALLSQALELDGLQQVVSRDPSDLVALCRDQRPSLVLLDRHPPGADGLELCRLLTQGPEAPAVVLEASEADLEDLDSGFFAGATDWLIRPYRLQYARTRIRAWLLRGLRKTAAPAVHEAGI